MDKKFKKHVSELWQRYFPNAEQPIAVFYADTLHGAGCEVMLTFAFAETGNEQPRCILGGMDTAMRSCLKQNIQTFSIAYKRFEQMVSFAEKTFLDTYIWQPLKNRT